MSKPNIVDVTAAFNDKLPPITAERVARARERAELAIGEVHEAFAAGRSDEYINALCEAALGQLMVHATLRESFHKQQNRN